MSKTITTGWPAGKFCTIKNTFIINKLIKNYIKMKRLLATNPSNITALIARLALGITLFPHGAQKLFGAFGGYGFSGTMGFLTTQAGLPYIIALLVILIESIGSLFVLFGFLTR